jgi:type IV pilus assembly protein PilV
VRQSIQAFTLIEVLISVLILSVGLLGASGLQLRGLDANRNAFFRTEATQLANDIANSIQVNKTTSYSDIALTTTPTVVIDCTANNCSQMAAYDTAQWLCSINSINATDDSTYTACSNLNIVGVLPNGKASMVKNGNEYAITVQWSDISTSTASSVNLVVVQ